MIDNETRSIFSDFGCRVISFEGVNSLDSFVRDNDLPNIDFIKLDIDGSELSMLQGAANTIARFKPKLAISTYHKSEDLWTLIDFIRSIHSDYEFSLRYFKTTYDSMPHMFPTDILNYCQNFNLPPRIPNFDKSVLFAR